MRSAPASPTSRVFAGTASAAHEVPPRRERDRAAARRARGVERGAQRGRVGGRAVRAKLSPLPLSPPAATRTRARARRRARARAATAATAPPRSGAAGGAAPTTSTLATRGRVLSNMAAARAGAARSRRDFGSPARAAGSANHAPNIDAFVAPTSTALSPRARREPQRRARARDARRRGELARARGGAARPADAARAARPRRLARAAARAAPPAPPAPPA